jgi:hypothetical protein
LSPDFSATDFPANRPKIPVKTGVDALRAASLNAAVHVKTRFSQTTP